MQLCTWLTLFEYSDKEADFMCVEDKLIIGTKRFSSFQKMVSVAGELAVRETLAAGLPVTYVSGTKIIKEYSDGRKEELGTISPAVSVEKRVFKL